LDFAIIADFRSNKRLAIFRGVIMATLVRGLGLSVLLICAGQAMGQVAPPTPVIAPPAAPAPPAGGATAATRPSGAAAPAASSEVRGNQALTMNAMIGSLKGEPIFLTDIFRPIDGDLRELAATSASAAAFEAAAKPLIRNSLTELEREILIVSVAESKLTEQDKDRIQFFLEGEKKRLLASYGGVAAAAERALQAFGSSIARELRVRRRVVVTQLYREKYFWPLVVVTGDMVRNAYERDPKRWQEVAAVALSVLTLPVSNWLRSAPVNGERGPILANPTPQQIKDAENQALATGREIVDKLKAGADFARLVEDYDSADQFRSKGGSRGLISKGDMLDAKLEDYIFSLPANTIGTPYLDHHESFRDSTVRIIKVGPKKTARTVPFNEAEPVLFAELREQQRRELDAQEMAKLTAGALKELEVLERMLPVAVDAAVVRYAIK
jgi:hypothetical protein